tara:strand:- start:25623 stop:25901 length:279 start_codon:yes stop_codon:yes gene_type:complete
METICFIIIPRQNDMETVWQIVRDDLYSRREILRLSSRLGQGLSNFYTLLELMGKQIEIAQCNVVNADASPVDWLVEYDQYETANALRVITI